MDTAAEELRALKTELQSMKTQCVHCVCAHTHIPTHTLSFLRGSVCVCVSACVRVCVCLSACAWRLIHSELRFVVLW